MPTYTVDPVTGIVIPTPGQEPGEQYAVDVSNALLTLAHLTHTGAAHLDGYQIPSAGINFNADLSAQSNNLTSLRSTRYVDQPSVLVGVGDTDCIYFKGGDLWINDGAGTPVQITAGAIINASAATNYNTKAISSNYTINSTDGYVVFNADPTAGTILVTLPLANTVPAGRFYLIKDATGQAGVHTITVQKAGSDTVDGVASVLIDFIHGAVGVMSDGVSRWAVWSYDRLVYHSGETITLQSGATLNLQAGSVFTMAGAATVPSSGSLTLQSGSTLNINNGTATTAHLSSGSSLAAESGSTTEFKSGSTLTIDDHATVGATLDTGSFISLLGTAQLTGTSQTIIATDGYAEIQNGGLLQVQSGGKLDCQTGSIVTMESTPTFNLGATFQGLDTLVSIGNGVNTTFQSGSFLQMLTGSLLISMFAQTKVTAIDYSVGPTDFIILADASSNIVQITLPAASANPGRVIIVNDYKGKSLSTHNVKIVMTGLDKLDNIATSYSIQADWGCVTCVSDGISVWSVISNSETAV